MFLLFLYLFAFCCFRRSRIFAVLAESSERVCIVHVYLWGFVLFLLVLFSLFLQDGLVLCIFSLCKSYFTFQTSKVVSTLFFFLLSYFCHKFDYFSFKNNFYFLSVLNFSFDGIYLLIFSQFFFYLSSKNGLNFALLFMRNYYLPFLNYLYFLVFSKATNILFIMASTLCCYLSVSIIFLH